MPAYVIVKVDVHDTEVYEKYKKLTPAGITAYGGRFVVRGGDVQALEGVWSHDRLVVLEFESVDRAKEWWSSPEYAPARALRWNSASSRLIVVEGV